MEEIYVIGEHKDIAIYLVHENGKRIYMHGLNPLDNFNTLDETLYDIDEILTYKTYVKEEMNNETGRV